MKQEIRAPQEGDLVSVPFGSETITGILKHLTKTSAEISYTKDGDKYSLYCTNLKAIEVIVPQNLKPGDRVKTLNVDDELVEGRIVSIQGKISTIIYKDEYSTEIELVTTTNSLEKVSSPILLVTIEQDLESAKAIAKTIGREVRILVVKDFNNFIKKLPEILTYEDILIVDINLEEKLKSTLN